MVITVFYGSLLAPLFIMLAVRVIGVRRTARIALGDGGDDLLRRRIRVHANFAEYALRAATAINSRLGKGYRFPSAQR